MPAAAEPHTPPLMTLSTVREKIIQMNTVNNEDQRDAGELVLGDARPSVDACCSPRWAKFP
jgi:hypothetical protein